MLSVTIHLYERIVASMLDDLEGGRLRPGDRVDWRPPSRSAGSHRAKRSQGRGTFVVRELPDLERVGAGLGFTPEPAGAIGLSVAGVRSGLIGSVLPNFNDSYGLHLVYAIEKTLHGR